MACNCLDCHAKLYAKRGSCSCSLCADRYRQEIQAALAPVRTIFAMMTAVGRENAGGVEGHAATRAALDTAIPLVPSGQESRELAGQGDGPSPRGTTPAAGIKPGPAFFLPTAPTPRKAGDTLSESRPTVASVAVGSDAGWRS